MQSIRTLPDNQLGRVKSTIDGLPLPRAVRGWLLNQAIGRAIPFLGTSSVELESVTPDEAVLKLRNRRKVQNHMKTVHGSASFLLAEAATGVALAANLPDGCLYSTTHAEADYTRKSKGDLTAVARVDDAMRLQIATEPTGTVSIPVTVTDEAGQEPARFVVEWSWKKK